MPAESRPHLEERLGEQPEDGQTALAPPDGLDVGEGAVLGAVEAHDDDDVVGRLLAVRGQGQGPVVQRRHRPVLTPHGHRVGHAHTRRLHLATARQQ